MALSPQEALIYVMIVTASADAELTDQEFARIDALVGRLPVFAGFDRAQLPTVANACADLVNDGTDIEKVLEMAIAAIPQRLHDTAYALAVEVAAVDLELQQEELRFLEMVRDGLALDRLVTAAIETAARARYRRA
ncbi:MAG TPA: tellurite resistance TerB family protein [Devosiaceae bacterium]|jgi:tellurite resistance protein|nr:tellurite resistance TerB family protein [Devosiaceae bacterium]